QEFLMYSREFPSTNGQIYDEIKYGKPGLSGYGKMNLFRPDAIQEMNYNAGCHSCNPQGNVKLCPKTDIITLHYHYPGLAYRLRKNRYIAGRLSDINKQMGWGVHHTWAEKKVIADFEEAMKHLVKVV
ncbi:MAG: hypothetical protein PHS33_08730, partial [Candidatus Omnitrophica bacterium]|nr:hypothetical protein [Candidatus Omnitrophota bacterium]